MKKIFLVLLLSSIFVITGCNNSSNNEGETGCFKKSEFGNSKYTVSIDSINCGNPSGNNLFNVSTESVSREYNGKKYKVYYNISFIEIYNHKANNDYSDINSYKEISINNKKFKYIINQNNTISLIYEPANIDCYMLLSVSTSVFDENGNMADDDYNISIDDLQNNQVTGTINFEFKEK